MVSEMDVNGGLSCSARTSRPINSAFDGSTHSDGDAAPPAQTVGTSSVSAGKQRQRSLVELGRLLPGIRFPGTEECHTNTQTVVSQRLVLGGLSYGAIDRG